MKTLTAKLTIRPARRADSKDCGAICHHAFAKVSGRHGFPPDFPTLGAAEELIESLLERHDVYAVVAEFDRRVVGSNFLWRHPPVAGIGPITVEPSVQAGSIGRSLMEDVLSRAEVEGFPAVRLVQAAYNRASMSLYAKLGFEVREPLVCLQGPPILRSLPGREVRAATLEDISACDALCRRVHGHDRGHELRSAVDQHTGQVVVRDGRITGYTTQLAFFGHAVSETDEDLWALIAAAPRFDGPGFLLPSRAGSTLRWCLDQGLRIVQPMTLMTRGLYNEPRGVWLPSVLY